VSDLYRVQKILRDVFDDPTLSVTPALSMKTHPAWDSVATVHIVLATEEEFGIRFTTDEVAGVKSVADLLAVVEARRS
jgi:acyl carrier protein